MSGKILFACSKCFSRHPFEELSSGQQLCKNCRGSTSVGKCTFCRSEFLPSAKSQSACKKCEYGKGKYGKPQACEWCKIVAAFGSTKCMRCSSYEAKYGPPVHCDECKLRSAFDRRDENKKVNGKLLCWLCTCAYKRALMKAQQDGRISSSKKRPHEKSSSHRENSTSKKPSRPDVSKGGSNTGLELPEKNSRSGNNGGNGTIVAPAVISIDPNSTDHVVAITNLKERIASLEKRLQMKDKELLEKDKQLTELKGKNFERENDMRNKLKEMDRLNDMKVENLNRKITSLLREIAGLKKANKKSGGSSSSNNSNRIDKGLLKPENVSPKEDLVEEREKSEKEDVDKDFEKNHDGERDEKESVRSGSSSPSSN